MALRLPPIYPITDKRLAGKDSHLAIVKELVRGGATLVQIRDKETPVRDLLLDLRRCIEFASQHGVELIVNDRCDLVLSIGAAGVHLGQEDLPPVAARRILGRGKAIGYSTHSLEQVRKAERAPVDYVGFGPVYESSTKQDSSPVAGLALLKKATRLSSRPVVAIGGIGIEEIREVLATGAQSAAVISALMKADNLALQMERFLEKSRGRG